MDEILIGEKKYVSSKRAAKATGYAKDYIGQLCREGRVPARLVGRSWYVLESAIQDHRFGNPVENPKEKVPEKAEPIHSTWQSPRYETFSAEDFPSVNRLRDEDEESEKPKEASDVSQHLQDSWKAWFDRIADTAAAPTIPDVVPEKPEESVEEPVAAQPAQEAEEEEEINVPIRTIHRLPPKELLPRRNFEIRNPYEQEVAAEKRPRVGGRRVVRAIQLIGILVAVCMAALAFIGSGSVDEYALSHRQVGAMAGVILYNR